MPNTLTNIMPVMYAQALETLREQCVMPRLVNTDYADAPAGQGDTVNWPIPSAQPVSDVAPQAAPVAGTDQTPLRASVQLNRWRKTGFYLTDKERSEIGGGFRSMQLAESVKALANDINAFILSRYVRVASTVGAPGTQITAGSGWEAQTAVLRAAIAKLDGFSVPEADRRLVVHHTEYADMLGVENLVRADARGSAETILVGQIGTILGLASYKDQAVPTHGATQATAGAITVNGNQAAGLTTISLAKATNATNLIVGDVLRIGTGANQIEVAVAANVTLTVGNTNVAIASPLPRAISGGEAVALVAGAAAYRVNLAFHRDAFAFASRRLTSEVATENMMSMADPVSQVVLRMEVSRQHKQDYVEFDVLYGAECIRPDPATRVVE